MEYKQKNMKIKLTSKDIIWSYIGTILSMAANFLMLPLIMYFLDGEKLGLWYVFASIGGIAVLFDFGFCVTFARNITYAWSGARSLKKEGAVFSDDSQPDFLLIKKVLSACKVVYGIIAGIAFLLLLTAGTYYIYFLTTGFEGYIHITAWIIYAVGICLNLYYGYYASFLRGVGNVMQANKNTVYARLVQITLMAVLLFLGWDILGISIAYAVYGIVFRLLGRRYFYAYCNIGMELAKIERSIPWTEIFSMVRVVWYNAWRDGIIAITNYFSTHMTTLLCSMYLSLEETGTYAVGLQAAAALAVIAGTLYSTYQPELQSAYITCDTVKVRKTMSLIVMSFLYLFALGTVLFCLFGMPLLRMVKPEAVLSMPIMLGLCLCQLILNLRNCYTSYFSCTNRIIYIKGFVFAAILSSILSIAALDKLHLGLWGIIGAQIISQLVYNVWYFSMLAHREMKLSLHDMFLIGTKEFGKILLNIIRKI